MYRIQAIHSRADIDRRAPGIVDRFPRDHPYVALTANPTRQAVAELRRVAVREVQRQTIRRDAWLPEAVLGVGGCSNVHWITPVVFCCWSFHDP